MMKHGLYCIISAICNWQKLFTLVFRFLKLLCVMHLAGKWKRLTGTITDVVFKGVFFEIFVDVGGFIWMVQTTHYHAAGNTVGMYIEPDAIHIMKRSEYSGEFGDYSTFSDEMDHISDADYNWEEESDEQSGS